MGTIIAPHGTKLTEVLEGKQRMRFWLNGEEILVPVRSFVMALKTPNADFQVTYGMGPSGYDDVAWREIGGGGVVDTLFTIINSQLYIGVITQMRPYQSDQPVRNAIRGYLDPKLTRMETASAEAVEEGGINLVAFELPGDPANPNNASVESWDGGITHYAMYTPPELLEPLGEEYVFKQGLAKPIDKIGDKILSSQFIHWKAAARLGCQMTRSGGFALMAHLDDIGVMMATFGEYPK